jgi:hypothetical protein
MRFVAELSVGQNPPCPAIGAGPAPVWGDVDCSGDITSVDALKTLRFAAGMTVSQSEPCIDIGAAFP